MLVFQLAESLKGIVHLKITIIYSLSCPSIRIKYIIHTALFNIVTVHSGHVCQAQKGHKMQKGTLKVVNVICMLYSKSAETI